MQNALKIFLCVLFFSSCAMAQQQNSFKSEVELGALYTTGNTEDENIKYKLSVGWLRGNWDYRLSTDGLRSSKEGELSARRQYHATELRYSLSEDSFVLGRLAYEDDRFNGYDSQSDATISYGRKFLQNISTMSLSSEAGAGTRRSISDEGNFNEIIFRVAGKYEWSISENSSFVQNVSIEAGDETSIYRSESAIEANIVSNLALRFAVKVKHQSAVPIGREKTDTESAVTLVLSF